MNPSRYEELLGHLLEGELGSAQANELAAGMAADPGLQRDLSRHLALWEIWSQQQAPERSSEAFINALKTRLRVENEDPEVFATTVLKRFDAPQPQRTAMERLMQILGAGIRRPRVAWAVLVLVLTVGLWFAVSRPAHADIKLQGEAVCTACVLHETHEHTPALRVVTGATTNIYYLDPNPVLTGLQDYFCSGPNAATAEGSKRTRQGRLLFRATTINIPAANQPRETPTNSIRRIFPI